MRVAPGADPEAELKILMDFLKARAPWGVEVEVTRVKASDPFIVDLNKPAVQAAREALRQAYGKDVGDHRQRRLHPAARDARQGVPRRRLHPVGRRGRDREHPRRERERRPVRDREHGRRPGAADPEPRQQGLTIAPAVGAMTAINRDETRTFPTAYSASAMHSASAHPEALGGTFGHVLDRCHDEHVDSACHGVNRRRHYASADALGGRDDDVARGNADAEHESCPGGRDQTCDAFLIRSGEHRCNELQSRQEQQHRRHDPQGRRGLARRANRRPRTPTPTAAAECRQRGINPTPERQDGIEHATKPRHPEPPRQRWREWERRGARQKPARPRMRRSHQIPRSTRQCRSGSASGSRRRMTAAARAVAVPPATPAAKEQRLGQTCRSRDHRLADQIAEARYQRIAGQEAQQAAGQDEPANDRQADADQQRNESCRCKRAENEPEERRERRPIQGGQPRLHRQRDPEGGCSVGRGSAKNERGCGG